MSKPGQTGHIVLHKLGQSSTQTIEVGDRITVGVYQLSKLAQTGQNEVKLHHKQTNSSQCHIWGLSADQASTGGSNVVKLHHIRPIIVNVTSEVYQLSKLAQAVKIE